MISRTLVAAILAASFAAPAQAACTIEPLTTSWAPQLEMHVEKVSGQNILILSGIISPDDVDRFDGRNFDQDALDEIWINSPGGDLEAALELAGRFRRPVRVPSGWTCGQACLLAVGETFRPAGADPGSLLFSYPITRSSKEKNGAAAIKHDPEGDLLFKSSWGKEVEVIDLGLIVGSGSSRDRFDALVGQMVRPLGQRSKLEEGPAYGSWEEIAARPGTICTTGGMASVRRAPGSMALLIERDFAPPLMFSAPAPPAGPAPAAIVALAASATSTPSLPTRTPTMSWEEAEESLKRSWSRLESSRSFGGADSSDNIPLERKVLAAMEELVALASVASEPASIHEVAASARKWGLLEQARRDLGGDNLPAIARAGGDVEDYLDDVELALSQAATGMAVQLASLMLAAEPSTVQSVQASTDPKSLDTALKSGIGIPMAAICGWGPFEDQSLTAVSAFPRDPGFIPAGIKTATSARCHSFEKDQYWSAGELARLDADRSAKDVSTYKFAVPAKYGAPSADEIRRAFMREALANTAAVRLDDRTLLVSQQNQLGRDFGAFGAIGAGYSKTAPGFIQTINGVRRISCSAATPGGYNCRFILDLKLKPNAAASSFDSGALSALSESVNRAMPVELTYRFEFTQIGWRSSELGEGFAVAVERNQTSFYNALASASQSSKKALCALGSGGNEAWVSLDAGCN